MSANLPQRLRKDKPPADEAGRAPSRRMALASACLGCLLFCTGFGGFGCEDIETVRMRAALDSPVVAPPGPGIAGHLSAVNVAQPVVPALPGFGGGCLWPFVNLYSGNLLVSYRLLNVPALGFDWDLRLYYNSLRALEDRGVGPGWRLSYDVRLEVGVPDASSITVHWGDGRRDVFTANGPTWVANPSLEGRVIVHAGNEYVLTTKHQRVYFFSANGLLVSFRDPNQNQWALTYNAWSRIATISDPSGRTCTLAYDQSGHVVAISGLPATPIQLQYDANMFLVTVADPGPNGFRHSFAYDASQRLRNVADETGQAVASFEYYGANPQFSYVVRDAIGNVAHRTFEFDSGTRTTTVRDSLSQGQESRTSYTFDAEGLCTSATDGPLGTTQVAYDAATNKVTAYTDADGHTTSMSYNNLGDLLMVTDALGSQWLFTYDATFHVVTTQTSPTGGTVTIAYDLSGNPTSYTNPLGQQSSFTYTPEGLVQTSQDPLGNVTTYGYDASGNLNSVTDPAGFTMMFGHTARGEVTSVLDQGGNAWSINRNGRGEATSVVLPGGSTYAIAWTPRGEPLSVTDPTGATTTYEHDGVGRLVRTTDPLNGVWALVRDGAGNVIQGRDPLNRQVSYTVDAVGRVLSSTDPDGGTWTWTYGCCDASTRTSPTGSAVSYQFDVLHRLVAESWAGGSKTFGYDANSDLTSVSLSSAGHPIISYAFSRDAARRLVGVNATHLSRNTTIAVNAVGLPIDVTDNIRPAGHVTFAYSNRLLPINAMVPGAGVSVDCAFTARRQLSNLAFNPGPKTGVYVYNGAGWLSSIVNQGGVTNASYNALRNARGDVTRIDVSSPAVGANTHSFGWDAAGGLVMEDFGNPNDLSFTQYVLDAARNRTQRNAPGVAENYTYSAAHRLLSVTGTTNSTRQWNADGFCTVDMSPGVTTSCSYRADGAVESITQNGQQTLVTIGPFGEIARVVSPSGQQTWFGYDWSDRGLLRRVAMPTPGALPTEELVYIPEVLGSEVPVARLRAPFNPGTSDAVLAGPSGVAQVIGQLGLLSDRYHDAFGNVLAQTGAQPTTQTYLGMEDRGLTGFYLAGQADVHFGDGRVWYVASSLPRTTIDQFGLLDAIPATWMTMWVQGADPQPQVYSPKTGSWLNGTFWHAGDRPTGRGGGVSEWRMPPAYGFDGLDPVPGPSGGVNPPAAFDMSDITMFREPGWWRGKRLGPLDRWGGIRRAYAIPLGRAPIGTKIDPGRALTMTQWFAYWRLLGMGKVPGI